MAAWDVAAEALAPLDRPRPRPKPVARKRPVPRRRVTSGVVWIVFVAVLLTGIVALNVAVLRLNVQLDRSGRDRANLRAENQLLQAEVSTAAASARIQALARARGFVPASETTYVRLGRTGR